MRSLFVTLMLLCAPSAFAGFMAEPTLGIATGSLTGTTPAGASLTATEHNGVALGLRLGYNWGNFWSAFEGSMATGKGKAGSSSYDMTDTNAGLLFGYNFTKNRVYIGYMVMSDLKQKDDTDEITYSGSAMKAGYGMLIAPRVTLNLEILVHQFSKVKSGTAELAIKDVYGSLNNAPILLTMGYLF